MSVRDRFTTVPAVPQGGFTDYQTILIATVKENVELLTGLRGEIDTASKAITQGQITTNPLGAQKLVQVTAKGSGFAISGQNVPSLDDFQKLVLDVQTLATDVAETRAAFNILIQQMKGL